MRLPHFILLSTCVLSVVACDSSKSEKQSSIELTVTAPSEQFILGQALNLGDAVTAQQYKVSGGVFQESCRLMFKFMPPCFL